MRRSAAKGRNMKTNLTQRTDETPERRHQVLECGDLSPLFAAATCRGDSVGWASAGKTEPLDAVLLGRRGARRQSGDKSPHSKKRSARHDASRVNAWRCVLFIAAILASGGFGRAADTVTETFQKALFEEEANQNYDAAMRAYRDVVARMDEQRKLAATAVFRLGECFRKLGQTNDAVAQYQRILREFADQPTLVNLSRQNLVGLSASQSLSAGPSRSKQMPASAEAEELARTERILVQLAGWDLSHLRRLLPTILPDTEVDRIERMITEAEERVRKQTLLLTTNDTAVAEKASAERDRARADEANYTDQLTKRIQEIMVKLEERVARLRIEVAKQSAEAKREILADDGNSAPVLSQTARLEQKRLLEEEIKLAEQEVSNLRVHVANGVAPKDSTIPKEREILALRRQLAALDVGPAATSTAAGTESGATDEEDKEIRRIQAMIKNSPDLINAPGPDKLTPLDSAARKGQLVVARFLLDNKADPNFRPRFGTVQFPLSAAAANGHKAMVELLLAHGAQVNVDDGDPLRIAAEKGFQSVVEALLAAKANPNLRDYRGQTALHRAVENRFPAIAELLIKNGADVNVVNRVGKPGDDPNQVAVRQADGTPLHIAASQGDIAMVSLLLSNRADVNLFNVYGETPLHVSASQLPIVTNLLAAGADVNRAVADGRYKGWTPLLYAVSWNGTNAAKALLAAGADPNAYAATSLNTSSKRPTQRVGYTPLLMAVTKGEPEMVELLLDNKADPNKEMPLTVAVSNGDVASTKALLEHGANVETKFDDGETPLLRATRAADEEMVTLLLEHKANVDALTQRNYGGEDVPGSTALMMAARKGHTGIAKLLLAQSANPNAADSSGSNPMHTAVARGNAPLARLLLTNGVNAETRFYDGNTCLAVAVQQRDLAMATLLLDHHADPNATNKFGHAPLHLVVVKSSEARSPSPPPFGSVSMAGPVPISPAAPSRAANAGHPPAPTPADLVELAKLLLDRKADPNLRDNNGMTPLNLFGVPANPRDDTQKALVALLRERGAKDALPDLAPDPNVIRVWRQGLAKGDVVFTKDSAGVNRFSLMDVLAGFYRYYLRQAIPKGSQVSALNSWLPVSANGSTMEGHFTFPDLAKLKIRRMLAEGTWQQIPVDLTHAGGELDCTRDVELRYGDVLEIPERDHPLSERPMGLTEREHDQLVSCLRRSARLIFKGATNVLEIAPSDGRYLSRALSSPQALGILSTSADLSRVKVTRRNPEPQAAATVVTFDVQKMRNSPPSRIHEDFALRDGDEIEVPDK